MFLFLLVPLPFIDEYTPLSNTKNDDTRKSHTDSILHLCLKY